MKLNMEFEVKGYLMGGRLGESCNKLDFNMKICFQQLCYFPLKHH